MLLGFDTDYSDASDYYPSGHRRYEQLVKGRRVILSAPKNAGGPGPIGIGVVTESFSAGDVFDRRDLDRGEPVAP